VLSDLSVGFRFVFGDRSTVFLLVIISALYNLGASAFVFVLPVYAKNCCTWGRCSWAGSGLPWGRDAHRLFVAGGETEERCAEPDANLVSGTTVGGLAVCTSACWNPR
jgi:hypothetical protein